MKVLRKYFREIVSEINKPMAEMIIGVKNCRNFRGKIRLTALNGNFNYVCQA